MEQQSKIIREAKSWIGTKYQANASLKGQGCDCLGLVIGIHRALYDKNARSSQHYSKLVGSHQNFAPYVRHYKQKLLKLFSNLEKAENFNEPIIGLFEYDYRQPHLGVIYMNNHSLFMIHAHEARGMVVEHRVANFLFKKLKYKFKFIGV